MQIRYTLLFFNEVRSLFLIACSEKNLQDAHISYIGHGHMVRTHLQQIKARTSELIEFGDSCFIFVVVVRFADNDHDRQTSRSVLLQTFFSACRKVIFDLRKNRRGYKNHLHKQMENSWCICEFMKRSICLSNPSGQYNVLRCRRKKTAARPLTVREVLR